MEIERRILRSTSIILSASLVSQLANFAFVVYFARAYSPEFFGEYSFALSLGSLSAIFVSLGTNGLLLRKCSQEPGEWRKHVEFLIPAQLSLVFAIWLIIVFTAKLLGLSGSELRIVAIVSSFQLLTPIWGLLCIGFTSTERMAYAALSEVGIRLSIMLVGGAAIWAGASVEGALLVLPASAIVATFVLSRLAFSEFGRPQLRFNSVALICLWREALPFFGILALSVAYDRIGLLFLRSVGGAEQVGIFASAERLVMAVGILHIAFAKAIFPPIVKLIATDKVRFRQLADRCSRFIMLISLPLASVLYLFAEDLIDLLFGDRYRQASVVLRIVSWLIAFKGVSVVLESIGIASDHKRLVLIAKASGLACLLVLCALLLPTMGASGLAIALLAAQILKLLIVCVGLRPTGYLPSIVRPSLPILFACAITLGVAAMLADQVLWLRAAVVLVLGTTLLWLFRAIRGSDIVFFGQLLRGGPGRPDV